MADVEVQEREEGKHVASKPEAAAASGDSNVVSSNDEATPNQVQAPPAESKSPERPPKTAECKGSPSTSAAATAASLAQPLPSPAKTSPTAAIKKKLGRPRKYPLNPNDPEGLKPPSLEVAERMKITSAEMMKITTSAKFAQVYKLATLGETITSSSESSQSTPEKVPNGIPDMQGEREVEATPPSQDQHAPPPDGDATPTKSPPKEKSTPLIHPEDAAICRKLSDQVLIRSAKINALAVLQEAESKRVIRQSRIASMADGKQDGRKNRTGTRRLGRPRKKPLISEDVLDLSMGGGSDAVTEPSSVDQSSPKSPPRDLAENNRIPTAPSETERQVNPEDRGGGGSGKLTSESKSDAASSEAERPVKPEDRAGSGKLTSENKSADAGSKLSPDDRKLPSKRSKNVPLKEVSSASIREQIQAMSKRVGKPLPKLPPRKRSITWRRSLFVKIPRELVAVRVAPMLTLTRVDPALLAPDKPSEPAVPVKKKRGRPRKYPLPDESVKANGAIKPGTSVKLVKQKGLVKPDASVKRGDLVEQAASHKHGDSDDAVKSDSSVKPAKEGDFAEGDSSVKLAKVTEPDASGLIKQVDSAKQGDSDVEDSSIKPTQDTQPGASAEPDKQATNQGNSDYVDSSVQPTQEAEPDATTERDDLVEQATSAKQDDAVKPTQEAEPDASAERDDSVKQATSAKQSDPDDADSSVKPTQEAKPNATAEQDDSVKQATSAKQDDAVKPTQEAEPDVSAERDDSVKQATSAKQGDSSDADSSVKPAKEGDSIKPNAKVDSSHPDSGKAVPPVVVPKRRGRPPKRPKQAAESVPHSAEEAPPPAKKQKPLPAPKGGVVSAAESATAPPPKKKRGRPRKYPLPDDPLKLARVAPKPAKKGKLVGGSGSTVSVTRSSKSATTGSEKAVKVGGAERESRAVDVGVAKRGSGRGPSRGSEAATLADQVITTPPQDATEPVGTALLNPPLMMDDLAPVMMDDLTPVMMELCPIDDPEPNDWASEGGRGQQDADKLPLEAEEAAAGGGGVVTDEVTPTTVNAEEKGGRKEEAAPPLDECNEDTLPLDAIPSGSKGQDARTEEKSDEQATTSGKDPTPETTDDTPALGDRGGSTAGKESSAAAEPPPPQLPQSNPKPKPSRVANSNETSSNSKREESNPKSKQPNAAELSVARSSVFEPSTSSLNGTESIVMTTEVLAVDKGVLSALRPMSPLRPNAAAVAVTVRPVKVTAGAVKKKDNAVAAVAAVAASFPGHPAVATETKKKRGPRKTTKEAIAAAAKPTQNLAFYGGAPPSGISSSSSSSNEAKRAKKKTMTAIKDVLETGKGLPVSSDKGSGGGGLLAALTSGETATQSSHTTHKQTGKNRETNPQPSKMSREVSAPLSSLKSKDQPSSNPAPQPERRSRELNSDSSHQPGERDASPEIPLQNTAFTISVPFSNSSSPANSSSNSSSSSSSRKIKKRKSLETVLSSLLESKIGNGSKEPRVVKTVAETVRQEEAPQGGGEVGGATRDVTMTTSSLSSLSSTNQPVQRKTLQKRGRERMETSILSVVEQKVKKPVANRAMHTCIPPQPPPPFQMLNPATNSIHSNWTPTALTTSESTVHFSF